MSYRYPNCIYEQDCVKAPIEERCLEFCLEKILGTATPEEKRLILGYSDETASAIYQVYNNNKINSFDDIRQYLDSRYINEIIEKFKQISQFQLDYFRLDADKRFAVIAAIKNLGLDFNNDFESFLQTS